MNLDGLAIRTIASHAGALIETYLLRQKAIQASIGYLDAVDKLN